MANWIVVGVEDVASAEDDDGGDMFVRLWPSDMRTPGENRLVPLKCTPPTWEGPDCVKKHGQDLYRNLDRHPAIYQVLRALSLQPVPPSMYFHLNSRMGEKLRWESLCDAQGVFLALRQGVSIGRIAEPNQRIPTVPRIHVAPLKVMAILGARNINAAQQWDLLYKAVQEARDKGLETSILVALGDKDLYQKIQDGLASGHYEKVEVAELTKKLVDLKHLINRYEPHLLHLFCHGVFNPGVTQLHFATLQDTFTGSISSSLQIDIEDLAQFEALKRVYLVVLNCCQSGMADNKQHSMAYKLAQYGVPAVVSMPEFISRIDADTFCQYFYPDAFDLLHRSLKVAGEEGVIIDWAEALRPVREALSDQYLNPTNDPHWTLPIIYLNNEPLILKTEKIPSDKMKSRAKSDRVKKRRITSLDDNMQKMQLRLKNVANCLRQLSPSTPKSLREELLEGLHDIPDALKPDIFGNFSQNIREARAGTTPESGGEASQRKQLLHRATMKKAVSPLRQTPGKRKKSHALQAQDRVAPVEESGQKVRKKIPMKK